MRTYKNVVVSYLYLYAHTLKLLEYNGSIDGSIHNHHIERVHYYFSFPDNYQIEVLTRRYIHNQSIEKIRSDFMYASHSSICKIIDKSLKKLIEVECKLSPLLIQNRL